MPRVSINLDQDYEFPDMVFTDFGDYQIEDEISFYFDFQRYGYVQFNATTGSVQEFGSDRETGGFLIDYTEHTGILYLEGGNFGDILLGGSGQNTLSGLSGDDLLDGSNGNSLMAGGSGNDDYIVGNKNNSVIEYAGEGTDRVNSSISYTLGTNVENLTLTGSANLNGTGNDLDNVLIGNTGRNVLTGGVGNDTLDGGGGADRLFGGAGDDTYILGNSGVVVSEAANAGIDTVRASGNFTLGTNIENLVLTGAGGNGYGNSLANTITGNSGNNVLDGRGGADTLIGGLGNDTYVVDNAGDQVVEVAGQGNDLVRAAISYTLADNVERLELTSASNIAGTGNALNNTIVGGTGANTLTGLGGADILTGGTGRDTFVFAALSDSTVATSGRDTIKDFTQADTDRIDLRPIDANTNQSATGDQAFTWIGANAFTGAAGQLHYEASGNDTLVSGDVDGNGAADFAILLTGQIALTRADFLL